MIVERLLLTCLLNTLTASLCLLSLLYAVTGARLITRRFFKSQLAKNVVVEWLYQRCRFKLDWLLNPNALPKWLICNAALILAVVWIRRGNYRVQDLWKVKGEKYLLNTARLLENSNSSPLYMVTSEDQVAKSDLRIIPRIIHQTWVSEEIPEPVAGYVMSWHKHVPDWEYWFWTDQRADDFIRLMYPSFYKMFREYPEDIQRADAVRYFILYEFGGIYGDLDVKLLRNLDTLTFQHNCILPLEPMLHAVKMWSVDHLVTNAFMACRPHHPIMKLLIAQLPLNMPHFFKRGPMDTTGPIFLTRQVAAFEAFEEDQSGSEVHPENRVFIAPVGTFIQRKDYSDDIEEFCMQRQRMDRKICESAAKLNFTDVESLDPPYASHEYVHTYFGTLDGQETHNIRALVPGAKLGL